MDLSVYRQEIDIIDSEIVRLFERRMDIVKKVAEYKIKNNLPVFHPEREVEVLASKVAESSPEYQKYVLELFKDIMEISKEMQQEIISNI